MEELHQDNLPAVPKGTQGGTPVFIGKLEDQFSVEETPDTDDDGKPFIITIKQG